MDTQILLSLSLRQPCYQLIDHFLLFIDENHKQNLCGKILAPKTHTIGILFLVTQHFIEEVVDPKVHKLIAKYGSDLKVSYREIINTKQ
jgi:hypothetical protein